MLCVGLTGGIATGKSYVRRRLQALGVDTLDADALVHAAFAPGTETTRAITGRFGNGVIAPDGSVDRRRLGQLVFGDPQVRAELEQLTHPVVYAAARDWFAARASAGVRLAVADIPLLYETAHDGDLDVVLVAACQPDEQVRRLVARDGLLIAEARQRLAAQWPIGDKVTRADHVIWTTGSFAETDRQVDEVLALLTKQERSRA